MADQRRRHVVNHDLCRLVDVRERAARAGGGAEPHNGDPARSLATAAFLHPEQATEEGAVALQGDSQILGRDLVATAPLVLEVTSCL